MLFGARPHADAGSDSHRPAAPRPEKIRDRLFGRSSLASALSAGLELAKQGKLEIKQDGAFRPVYIRGKDVQDELIEEEENEDDRAKAG